MENRKQRSSSRKDAAADLPRTNAQYLLENPPQASTPELQAKQARLLRLLTGDSSTEPQDNSTGAALSASPTPGGRLPQRQNKNEMEGEEHGILAEKQRRERVRQMAQQAQRSPGPR